MGNLIGGNSRFMFNANDKWNHERETEVFLKALPASGLRILVIDDSDEVRAYFENILRNVRLSCDTAADSMTGIEMVMDAIIQTKPYDLIFIDSIISGYNGIDTARMIKGLVRQRTIIAMISVADWEYIDKEAALIGVDKFLAKPIRPSVLLSSIVEWVGDLATLTENNDANFHWDWNGRYMLLAEETDINQEIIIGMLEETGIAIECVEDGEQAVQAYLKAPQRYDVVLVDFQTSTLDGAKAVRLIRGSNTKRSKEIPIIAMTTNTFEDDQEACLSMGINDHIVKPVASEELMEKISRVLED